jgi:hypothetical protein
MEGVKMKKLNRYSLRALIQEATEPDKKQSRGIAVKVSVEGGKSPIKAADNSNALLAIGEDGGKELLQDLAKTLGTRYNAEYYVWAKRNPGKSIVRLGEFYKKGSGDPYTYEFLGKDGDKNKYRVISGPFNKGKYKSGKNAGKEIGTRPIGAIFTMGKELDPVPQPDPVVAQSKCTKIVQLYNEQKSKLKELNGKEESVAGQGAGPNANQVGSRSFTEDLEKAIKTLVTAEAKANQEGSSYDVALVSDAISNISNMKKNVEAVEDGSGQSGTNALVQRYLVFTAGDDTLKNDLVDIFNLFFFGLDDISLEYSDSKKACNDQIKKLGDSLNQINSSGDAPMNESLSRGSLYRRRYWGRY